METIWQPLEYSDSIRLLKFPAQRDPAARPLDNLSVLTIRLSDPDRPSYQALSYTWGWSRDRYPIKIDGVEVRVRQNLWNFFNQVLSSDNLDVTYLWVDALSISQTDLDEKASIVQRIGEIFHAAHRVLAWLGIEPKQYALNQSMSERITHDKYWTRTWIIQELLLARDILFCYGQHTFPYQEFHEIYMRHGFDDMYSLQQKNRTEWGHAACVCGEIFWLRREQAEDGCKADADKTRKHDLMRLVGAAEMSKCSILLDKVYALLSLVDWGGRTPVQVDYRISEEVLYFRTLTSVTKVDFSEAERLRKVLDIHKKELLECGARLFPNTSTSTLTVKTFFGYSENSRVADHWDLSQLPGLHDTSTVRRESPSHYLHIGSVERNDWLIRFHPTDVWLVFRQVNLTSKWVVKGIVCESARYTGELGVAPCIDECLDAFNDVEYQLDPPGDAYKNIFIPIKVQSWLSLCRHEWERLDRRARHSHFDHPRTQHTQPVRRRWRKPCVNVDVNLNVI